MASKKNQSENSDDDNKKYVTVEQFRKFIKITSDNLSKLTEFQQAKTDTDILLFNETEKLLSLINNLANENDVLRMELKEQKQYIEAILNKLNLEPKRMPILKEEKSNLKTPKLHDDNTERCTQCNKIKNKQSKVCWNCGYKK